MKSVEYSEDTAYRLYLSFETLEGLLKELDGDHPSEEMSKMRQYMIKEFHGDRPIKPEDMKTVLNIEDISIIKENLNNVVSSVRSSVEPSEKRCTVVKIASRCDGMLASVYEKETGECWI